MNRSRVEVGDQRDEQLEAEMAYLHGGLDAMDVTAKAAIQAQQASQLKEAAQQ